MYKRALMLPFSLIATACATPQTETSQKQICTSVPVEATGSRVETETECQAAE